jgi:hypothetical protein
MDHEVIQIEQYFINNRDPKHLTRNVNNLTSENLRQIVIMTLNISSSRRIIYREGRQKKNFSMK